MRLGRLLIILAILLLVGVGVVFLLYRFVIQPRLQQAAVQPTPTPPPVEIVFVAQPVSKGTELTAEMLTRAPWQQDSIVPGMVKAEDLETMIGRVPKYDLAPSQPLLTTMLLTEGETLSSSGSPWALSIPPGMVAVSVPINRLSSISYAPRPGDHVNVIASLLLVDVDTDFQSETPNLTGLVTASGPPDPATGERSPLTVNVASWTSPAQGAMTGVGNGIYGRVIIDPVLNQAVFLVNGERQRPRMVSHMLLQDVVVLQVGDFPLESQAATTAAGPTPTPLPAEGQGQAPAAQPVPDIITLIVRPQDAVALNFILLGQPVLATQLSLALRGANDTTRENTLPVTLGFLLEQYQIPVPAKVPYSLTPRIDALSPVPLPNSQPAQP
jgi:Flp pilus assembly protein CpaB